MKLFALLAVVGLAAASSHSHLGSEGLKWEPGHEYIYSYQGRLLTGLPELSSQHFSGMAIRCTVHLQVSEGGRLALQIRDAHYSRVSEELHPSTERTGEQEGRNWRHLHLPSFSPVPSGTNSMLSKTSLFEISEVSGKVKSVTVSEEEPAWSINFKKALIVLFQTQTMESEIEGNSFEGRSSGTGSSPSLWTSYEESIDGECETTYELNELPETVARSGVSGGETVLPKMDLCPRVSSGETKVYELTKTRNVNNCRKRSSYQSYKPGTFTCREGSCGGMWSRSSITRYTVCGTPDRFLIQSIINEGELTQDLLGFKTEKMLTGTRQVMKLISKERISSHLSRPSGSVVLRTLMYEYSREMIRQREELSSMSSSSSSVSSSPSSILSPRSAEEKRELMPKIERLLREIVDEDLFTLEGLPERDISWKVLTVSKALKVFTRDEIKELYRKMVSSVEGETKTHVMKNIIFDIATMSGTNECVRFLKEMITTRQMTTAQSVSFFMNLPRSLVTPTRDILVELFELVKSDFIREESRSGYLYNAAILSYSTLIQKACLAENHRESYPTDVFGRFCSKESAIISERWIPYLQEQLYRTESVEKKNVIVVALGLLSHEQILPVILPMIEEYPRTTSESGSESHMTRYLAVFSLVNVGRHYPERVLPILSSIFGNRAETTEIRIAAFNSLLKLEPDMALLQKIATLTWSETDVEVLKVINTALYSLSEQISMQDFKPSSALLVSQARLIYPLIKKTGGSVPSTASLYANEFLSKLKIGYERVNSWIGCRGSPLPSSFYNKLTYFLDEYKFTPLEYGFHLCGTDSLLQEVVDVITKKDTGMSKEQEVKSKLTREWNEVIERLAIKTREGDRMEGSVYMNLMEDSPVFASFKSISGRVIREKIESILRNPSELRDKMSGEREFSFQRVADLGPSETIIPSDMGLPIVVEFHMPTVFSVHGKISSEPSTTLSRFTADMRVLFESRFTGWVGTNCPFTGEYVMTGIDEHGVINLPADINLNVDIREGKVSMKIRPTTRGISSGISSSSSSFGRSGSSGGIDVLYMSVKPYTVRQSYHDLKPIFKSENFKMIRSRTSPKSRSSDLGSYLGLDLKLDVETETPYLGARYLLEKLSMFNWNPINKLRFPFSTGTGMTPSGMPSVRRHRISLKYFPESSATKEVDFVWKFGYATKEKNQPIKYHAIEVESGSSGRMVPFKIVSKPAGEHSVQSGRQQKTKEILERLNVEEEGKSVFLGFTANLMGSRTRTWSYYVTAGTGVSGLKQKWDVKVSTEHGSENVCMTGHLEIPPYSIWKLSEMRSETPVFKFRNEIGFGGSSCSESKIVVDGYTKTSETQKRKAEESPESKELRSLVSKGTPLIQLSELAEKVRRQHTTLDEVDYKISYVNVPSYVMYLPKKTMDVIKVYWMPYMTMENPIHSSSSVSIREESSTTMTTLVRTKMHPMRETFDVTIKTEGSGSYEQRPYYFSDVPLPYPLPYVLPLSYVGSPVSSVAKSLTGKPLHPTCTLEGRSLSTFDNRTLDISEMGECFHLLSGDCSVNKEYGVMVRNVESGPEGKKEIKVYLEKVVIELKPTETSSYSSYSSSGRKVIVKVNGSPIEVSKIEKRPIKTPEGKKIAEVIETKDGVIVLKSSKINVLTDGRKIKLEGSVLLKNKLCGLCGDNNNQKVADLRSPRMCLLSKPKLLVASYRVSGLSGSRCGPLESRVSEELSRESEICVKPSTKPTKVVRSFEVHSGECTKTRHEIVERGSEICFSKNPVVECGASCKPEGVREKRISFACMERSRAAEHIARKVREGKHVPSLRGLETSFSVERPVPARCSPVSSRGY